MTLRSLLHGLEADAPGLLLLALLISSLLLGVELFSRRVAVPREWTRKAAHVGTALLLLALPWLLTHLVSVAALAVVSAGALWGARRAGLLQSVHGVRRRSDGALVYPLSVLALFALSGDEPLGFCVPLVILGVSDAAAALVGQHLGRRRYRVGASERTLEGSLAFVTTAFAAAWGGLTLAGAAGPEVRPLLAAGVALVACAMEAVSVRGWDNLSVPLGSWLALWLMLRAPESAANALLGLGCVALACLVLVVAMVGGGITARRHAAEGGAR